MYIFLFQRLNVMVTRAKCLLIVIADRDTLIQDINWKVLIDFCEQNKAIVTRQRKLNPRVKFQ